MSSAPSVTVARNKTRMRRKKGERKGSPELRSPKTKKKSSDGQMKFARKELG